MLRLKEILFYNNNLDKYSKENITLLLKFKFKKIE